MPKKLNIADEFITAATEETQETAKEEKAKGNALPYYTQKREYKYLLQTWAELIDDLKVLAKLKRFSLSRLINEILLDYTMTEENKELIEKYKDSVITNAARRKK